KGEGVQEFACLSVRAGRRIGRFAFRGRIKMPKFRRMDVRLARRTPVRTPAPLWDSFGDVGLRAKTGEDAQEFVRCSVRAGAVRGEATWYPRGVARGLQYGF